MINTPCTAAGAESWGYTAAAAATSAAAAVVSRELAQIGISSGLISEADGNAIKELLRKGPVSVALNWTDVLPKANKVGVISSKQQLLLQQ